jgi:predicted ester cyclase
MNRIEWVKVKEIKVLQGSGANAHDSRKGITQMQTIIIAAVVVIAIVAGVYYFMSTQTSGPTSTEQTNMALARSMWETVNKGDLNALPQFYAPNYRRYLSLASAPLNSTQQIQRLAGLHKAFSNFNLTVVDMVAQGDFVVARLTFTGTQTGTFQGVPPTGKVGKVVFLEEVRIVNGKVVDHWGGPDWSDMLKQLGVKFTPGT